LTWQKALGRESKYFGFAVLVSLLFWIALAFIIEQDIIAQEYLYSRERNGFILTVAFLYIIRFSIWMSSREDTCEDSKWKAEAPLTQNPDPERPIMVGEAKEMWEKTTDYGRAKDITAEPGKRENQEPDDRNQWSVISGH